MKTTILAIILLVGTTLYGQSTSRPKMEKDIITQVKRLFEGADERNWSKAMAVMDKQVLLDYSSMTGNAATWLTPREITAAWSAFLPGFDRTDHRLTDLKVDISGDEATVNYHGAADHYYNEKVWTVEGAYVTRLRRIDGNWLVTAHTFNLQDQRGDTTLPADVTRKMERSVLVEKNRKVVDDFFIALETQRFEMLKEVFADNGRQLNPYAPEGFPGSFDGAEEIYRQYSGLVDRFGQMKFPRQIMATEDPNFFLVRFKGEIEIKSGGMYENDYLGTFKLENGKVVEYTEYFNQVVMARAFGLDLR